MTFLAPERLWFLLLIPALVVLYVLLQRRRGKYAVRFTNLALLKSVVGRRPGAQLDARDARVHGCTLVLRPGSGLS